MLSTETLSRLTTKIRDAEWSRDIESLKSILSDDLLFRRANKTLTDKAGYLAALEDKNNTYTYLENIDIQISVDDKEENAVVIVIVKAGGNRGENSFSGLYKNIRFFKNSEGWKLHTWYNEAIS